MTIETVVDKQGLSPGHLGETLPDRETIKSSGLGIILQYDTKDNKFYPHYGRYLSLDTNFAAKSIGSDLDADNLLPSAGLGLRFRASEEERVNMGVDFVVGEESDALYFRVGEAF
jgi:hypothetical protein